jgi:hypothetical protein
VGERTPPTRGFLDPGVTPEYGVITSPNIGHAVRWGARRPVPADGHWAYLGRANYFLAAGFYGLRSEAEALDAAARLRARYVVTDARPGIEPGSALARLHRHDGLGAQDGPRWERFRLITEGPAGGAPLTDVLGIPRPRGVIPYKLFEIVPGALLEVETAPHAKVEASLALVTPLRRRIVYRAEAEADASGLARLRLPYASEPRHPVRASGPWRVRGAPVGARGVPVGTREASGVPERALEGETLRVRLEPASPQAASGERF